MVQNVDITGEYFRMFFCNRESLRAMIKVLQKIDDMWLDKPQEATYKQFKIVKSLYTRKDIDCIYYAGDSGREGIYIQALIRNQIFRTAPKFDEKVVWIDSFTEPAILDGIKNAKPYASYQPMIDSGYARAISDWLIGMNFTEGFTLTSGTLVNVGRVMTPTHFSCTISIADKHFIIICISDW